MPLPRPRLGADVGAESLEALEWLGAMVTTQRQRVLLNNTDHGHHLISHYVSESHLPNCLLSCWDAGAGLVIGHIKLDNFLSLNLRILSVRTFNSGGSCSLPGL